MKRYHIVQWYLQRLHNLLNIAMILIVLLFFISYTPQSIELEHKLKPFIPDFIPAVGDIDAFIKVIIKKDACYITIHINGRLIQHVIFPYIFNFLHCRNTIRQDQIMLLQWRKLMSNIYVLCEVAINISQYSSKHIDRKYGRKYVIFIYSLLIVVSSVKQFTSSVSARSCVLMTVYPYSHNVNVQ